MAALFLDDDELRKLTGCAQKSRQVAQLRKMGVPFYVNARGAPVVACSVVHGGAKVAAPEKPAPTNWVPRVLRRA